MALGDAVALGSQLSAVAAFLALAALALTLWRRRPAAPWVGLAALLSAAWAGDLAWEGLRADAAVTGATGMLGLARSAGWYAVLLAVLARFQGDLPERVRTLRLWRGGLALFLAATLLASLLGPVSDATMAWRTLASLLLAVAGLVLVEQLFRNTPLQKRWEVKFLCLGVGAMFAFDLFLFADLVLFQAVDRPTWQARGAVNALVVPLIAASMHRQPQRSEEPTVSRQLAFHSAALIGAGIYLLLVGAGGYLLRRTGGDWGALLQVALLFGAVLLLVLLLSSGSFRTRLRVLINKNFFNYKYDYHDEWLRFTHTLSGEHGELPFRQRAIEAIAELVDSFGGLLWARDRHGDYRLEGVLNLGDPDHPPEPGDGELATFLAESGWVIDLDEYRRGQHPYGDLSLPAWLVGSPRYWLVVPLLQGEGLTGFAVLAHPRAPWPLEWEDRDLLKTAGRQLAVYVALAQTDEALLEARQFETFHRLAAFLVHDLKNVSGQLSLVLSNAERYRDNPEFVASAFDTVRHARDRLDRTLAQLRNAQPEPEAPAQRVELDEVLHRVVERCADAEPLPQLQVDGRVQVVGDRERLISVLAHLVRNAQEATPADGQVRLQMGERDQWGYIVIEDTGQGMDEQFIREQLFQPFQTTKGNAGMGIGVYEAREYIAQLGGRIDVRSCPGQGTVFTVRLVARGSSGSRPGLANVQVAS